MTWQAFHVFHPEPVELLLLDGVAGLCQRLKQERRIRRFCFVRYAEGGYHIRLRFEPTSAADAVLARSAVASALRQYLDVNSAAAAPIVEVPYEPELARYGGPQGVDIAETHFDFSSLMAFGILEPTRHLGARLAAARVGLALEAMLALTHGFGLTRGAIEELFRGYYRGTLDAIKMNEPPAAFAAAVSSQQVRLRAIQGRVFAGGDRQARWARAWARSRRAARRQACRARRLSSAGRVDAGVGHAAEQLLTHVCEPSRFRIFFNFPKPGIHRVGLVRAHRLGDPVRLRYVDSVLALMAIEMRVGDQNVSIPVAKLRDVVLASDR